MTNYKSKYLEKKLKYINAKQKQEGYFNAKQKAGGYFGTKGVKCNNRPNLTDLKKISKN